MDVHSKASPPAAAICGTSSRFCAVCAMNNADARPVPFRNVRPRAFLSEYYVFYQQQKYNAGNAKNAGYDGIEPVYPKTYANI